MSENGCRDCTVCTRSALQKLLGRPVRVVYKYLFSWNYGAVKRKCPDCGHFLSQHQRLPDGSFRD
jgi:hypothetical protein